MLHVNLINLHAQCGTHRGYFLTTPSGENSVSFLPISVGIVILLLIFLISVEKKAKFSLLWLLKLPSVETSSSIFWKN